MDAQGPTQDSPTAPLAPAAADKPPAGNAASLKDLDRSGGPSTSDLAGLKSNGASLFTDNGNARAPSPGGDSPSPTGSAAGSGPPPAAPQVAAGSIQGGGAVHGSVFITNNHHAPMTGLVTAWEDEVIAVTRLPEPSRDMDADEVQRQADALHEKRLLLVSHAPHLDQDAIAAMRAVLTCLQKRSPQRRIFAGNPDKALPLQSLSCNQWREDRRGSLLYLYRSADTASRNFFNSIEQVEQLRERLEQMDAHLVLTVSMPRTAALREEAEIARRIALWTFFDQEQPVADAATVETFTTPFELAVAVCAALFPGLGVGEFTTLIDRLAPEPEPAADPLQRARTHRGHAPPTRHERWWRGERDTVLAELGVLLCMPNEGSEFEGTEKGIFFEDASRRAAMPSWLCERHPILLSQHIEALTSHYLAPEASARFRVSYRRLVLRLDQLNIHRLTPEWLAKWLHASLTGSPRLTTAHNLVELLADLADSPHGGPLVTELVRVLGQIIREREAALVDTLVSSHVLPLPTDTDTPPYSLDFWVAIKKRAKVTVDEAAWGLAVPLHVLHALTTHATVDLARDLGTVLDDCDSQHLPWVHTAELERPGRLPLSLARVVFREMQFTLLDTAPGRWLASAIAIGQSHAPASNAAVAGVGKGSASHRRLAWDCLFTFGSLFSQPGFKQLSPAGHAAFLAPGQRQRLGKLLASLIHLTAPPEWHRKGRATPPDEPEPFADEDTSVDLESIIWIFKSLALASMPPEGAPAEQDPSTLLELVSPLRATLPSPQRMALADTVRRTVDVLFQARDALPFDPLHRAQMQAKRRDFTQQIQALQMVMRALRSVSPANVSTESPS